MVDHQTHRRDGRFEKFGFYGRDGGRYPGADGWVARLEDGVVVFARAEEGCCGVEGAEREEGVDADCEEGGEGLDEGALVCYGEGLCCHCY